MRIVHDHGGILSVVLTRRDGSTKSVVLRPGEQTDIDEEDGLVSAFDIPVGADGGKEEVA